MFRSESAGFTTNTVKKGQNEMRVCMKFQKGGLYFGKGENKNKLCSLTCGGDPQEKHKYLH